ncbi:MAG: agmatine deiminase family protein [Verrucomicrobiota bacterium]
MKSPRRFPAEWEPQEATWINWPTALSESFEFGIGPTRHAFLELLQTILKFEKAYVNIFEQCEIEWLNERLSDEEKSRTTFFDIEVREPYLRDSGPVFILESGKRLAVKFGFNAWGERYPPYDIDNASGTAMAQAIDVKLDMRDEIFEGGGLESNGAGTVLVSEDCFFARNRRMPKEEGTKRLKEALGAELIHWIPGAVILGDDTDGHVDVTTRFANEDTLLVARCQNPKSRNWQVLEDNWAHLQSLEKLDGGKYNLVALPMPEPIIHPRRGLDLPASYANFHIANGGVIVPVFDQPTDDLACQIIAENYPDREIVPINAEEIVMAQGGVHCLTNPVPQEAVTETKTD